MGKRMMLENGGSLQVDRHGTDAVIQIHDMEEDVVTVARATPAEWDAFVAAGNAALGRPGPGSTPLSDDDKRAAVYRIQRAVPKGYAYSYTDLITDLSDAIGAELDRAAAREAGPTVPRGALAPVLALHAQIAEESGEYRANLIEALLTALDAIAAKESGHADD